jgi:ABC-type antimicrobial peptide transport system permease subunit
MDQIVDGSISVPRFTLFLVALFAALAIALACIGTCCVMSYSVNQRTQEFGVRIALGARPWDVLRLVCVRGLSLAFIGVVVGITGALAFAGSPPYHALSGSAADLLTFSAVAVFAMAIAALDCYLPSQSGGWGRCDGVVTS